MAILLGQDLYNIFLTMGFNDFPACGYEYIDEYTIIIKRSSDTPLIFTYYNQSDWCLTTCKKYIKDLKGDFK